MKASQTITEEITQLLLNNNLHLQCSVEDYQICRPEPVGAPCNDQCLVLLHVCTTVREVHAFLTGYDIANGSPQVRNLSKMQQEYFQKGGL